MAPLVNLGHDQVEESIKNVIQDLYQLMVQVNTYDAAGKPTRDILEQQITSLDKSLQSVHHAATASSLPNIPPELIQYVDNGRNPDIYTREFVELARKGNQLMKGKVQAFTSFRDVLAREMVKGMPELRGDVERVLEATGGDPGEVLKDGAAEGEGGQEGVVAGERV